MSLNKREISTPGDDAPETRTGTAISILEDQIETVRAGAAGLTQLNNTDIDANVLAAEHEARTAVAASADALQRGDTDGALKILAAAQQGIIDAREQASAVQEQGRVDFSSFGPDVLEVSVPVVRRSTDVEKYGRETTYTDGTPLNKDGVPCTGNETAVAVVGRLLTRSGWIVARALPYQDVV